MLSSIRDPVRAWRRRGPPRLARTFTPGLARRCAAAGALAALSLPVLLIAGGFFADGGGHRFEGGWRAAPPTPDP